MSYTPIGWEDSPSQETPINAENLNHMEQGIADAHNESMKRAVLKNGLAITLTEFNSLTLNSNTIYLANLAADFLYSGSSAQYAYIVQPNGNETLLTTATGKRYFKNNNSTLFVPLQIDANDIANNGIVSRHFSASAFNMFQSSLNTQLENIVSGNNVGTVKRMTFVQGRYYPNGGITTEAQYAYGIYENAEKGDYIYFDSNAYRCLFLIFRDGSLAGQTGWITQSPYYVNATGTSSTIYVVVNNSDGSSAAIDVSNVESSTYASKVLNSNLATNSDVQQAIDENKVLKYSFSPVKVLKGKRITGYNTTTLEPQYTTYANGTAVVIPTVGSGTMEWQTEEDTSTYRPQVIALDANGKRLNNINAEVSGTTAKLNVSTNFYGLNPSYIAFWTTDIESVKFSKILPSDDLALKERTETTNEYAVSTDFNPPYLYSSEVPLYIYVQALFDKPFKMVSSSGENSIVQNGHNGYSLKNVRNLPSRTAVTIADNKKVLFIGDSYTEAGVYPKFVYDTIQSLGKSVTLVGTKGSSPYKHEGNSGWRLFTYAKCSNQNADFSTKSRVNPFWNPSTNQFDFAYYINSNNLQTPDIVFVNLGTNDFARGNHTTDAEILEYADIITASIKAFDVNIKIVFWLPTQLPVGINAGYNRWSWINNYSRILINNKEELNIDELCPVRYSFDCYEDGQFTTQTINDHEYKLLSDITHPSNIGYKHIGQMIIPYIHESEGE